jgi:glycosyltransferase involved in cell wall biosynthesis
VKVTYTRFALNSAIDQRLRILLLIPHLGGGGAERVTALLAAGLSAGKYELHLGLVTGQARECAEESLPASVTIHRLGSRRVRGAALPLLRLIRQLRPAVILSGMAHLNFLVLLLRPFIDKRTKILARQNSTVSSALASGELPRPTRFLYRLLYPRADRIICQTQAMADDLVREAGLRREKLVVLQNPIEVDAIRARVNELATNASVHEWSGPGPHLLAVGRLAKAKGFDMLLAAFAAVRVEFPAADLTILGAGSEEAALKAQAERLGLAHSAHFAGQVSEPARYFPGATAFVLSSRQEGMPNALLEAAAAGVPLVSLPSSEGLTDLLRGQPGVWLGEKRTEAALTQALLAALRSLRHGERFEHSFIEEFRLECALKAYESLIDSALRDAALRGANQ